MAQAAAAPPSMQKPKIMESVLENVGLTPLIRLNKVHRAEGVKCEICTMIKKKEKKETSFWLKTKKQLIVAKCEFFNAGGSVKDRIGRRMIDDAEKSGRIKQGDILIEVILLHFFQYF